MAQYSTLELNIENAIAIIQVNRPKALNAINQDVLVDLLNCFKDLRCNPEVSGVILTGAGEKAFVAGADIAAMQEMSVVDAQNFCELGHQTMRAIENHPTPVIAAVNGFALGGGLELALACDFIYAAKEAKLGLPEVNLGIFPGFGGTQRLARQIGRAKAKEMIMTADMLTADEAQNWGVVNRVFAKEELLTQAQKTLTKILSKGPFAIRLAKKVVNQGTDLALDAGLTLEESTFPVIFGTEDKKEGITAFLEKRKANFSGK